jgi:hypothetical protein
MSRQTYNCRQCGKAFTRKASAAPGIYCSRACAHLGFTRCEHPTRERLAELVESMPGVQIARKFGVTSITIRAWCRSMGIPTKPVGYWTKVNAGLDPNSPNYNERRRLARQKARAARLAGDPIPNKSVVRKKQKKKGRKVKPPTVRKPHKSLTDSINEKFKVVSHLI